MTRKQRTITNLLEKAGGKLPWIDLIFHGRRTLDSLKRRGIISLHHDGKDRHWILNKEHLANRNGKVSKAKLEAWCKSKGYPIPHYEAYGRKVCAYLSGPQGKPRKEFERELEGIGCKTNSEWCQHDGFTGTEVRNISYFKADGWDE
jgi:hypothetical protein